MAVVPEMWKYTRTNSVEYLQGDMVTILVSVVIRGSVRRVAAQVSESG